MGAQQGPTSPYSGGQKPGPVSGPVSQSMPPPPGGMPYSGRNKLAFLQGRNMNASAVPPPPPGARNSAVGPMSMANKIAGVGGPQGQPMPSPGAVPPNMRSPTGNVDTSNLNPYKKTDAQPLSTGGGQVTTGFKDTSGGWESDDTYQGVDYAPDMPEDWKRAQSPEVTRWKGVGGGSPIYTNGTLKMDGGKVALPAGAGFLSGDYEDPIAKLNREWEMWKRVHGGSDNSGPGGPR